MVMQIEAYKIVSRLTMFFSLKKSRRVNTILISLKAGWLPMSWHSTINCIMNILDLHTLGEKRDLIKQMYSKLITSKCFPACDKKKSCYGKEITYTFTQKISILSKHVFMSVTTFSNENEYQQRCMLFENKNVELMAPRSIYYFSLNRDIFYVFECIIWSNNSQAIDHNEYHSLCYIFQHAYNPRQIWRKYKYYRINRSIFM